MVFCACATQVYVITYHIKVKVWYSVHVPQKFM